MVSTVFSDSIVNATDLRNNQKQWFEKAYIKPITVNYGRRQLAIMNREQVGRLYAAQHYSELVLKACEEFSENSKSTIFPWIEYLSNEGKTKFHSELLRQTIQSIITGDWAKVEYIIDDWKATAEVERNPALAAVLKSKEDPSQYVEIEG